MSVARARGSYGEYNLFEKDGHYFALLSSTIDNNVDELIEEKKAIQSGELESLKESIDEAISWANSRGVYGLNDSSENAAIRVNSFNLATTDQNELAEPKLLVFNGQAYLVERKDYETLFSDQNKAERYFLNSISKGAKPELIFGYKNHNIVEFDRVYYGIRQDYGAVDFETLNPSILNSLFKSETVKGVMNEIDKVSITNDDDDIAKIKLLKTQREKFGPESTEISDTAYSKITASQSNTQKELEEYNGFLIYEFENTFFARPKNSAQLDFAVDDFFTRNDVVYDVSITGLREAIDAL